MRHIDWPAVAAVVVGSAVAMLASFAVARALGG